MKELAKKIANSSKKGDVIGLKGTLGVGKSFFADTFINSLLEEKRHILSPTFNLVYSYESKKGTIYHFDLYRVEEEEELYNIGLEDALSDGITLVEWPQIACEFLRKNYLEIEIKIIKGEEREVFLSGIKNKKY